jgi:glucan 1,3-beta-glucosidase
LALEKWITPSLYADTKAEDEYSLCAALGKAKAAERLKRHRKTWITDDDFVWLAAHGLNSVRIPVNYGVAQENSPFLPAMDSLDWAFHTAKTNGIGILIDLHGVPGSQNGWDHSGRQGALEWHTKKSNIEHSLRIVGELAVRCKAYESLIGIELLNEPRWDVPIEILKGYYRDAYHRVREHIGKDKTVVIHDGFRPFEWSNFMREPEYTNVLLDTHLYQCFTDEDRKRDAAHHVEQAAIGRKSQLDKMQAQLPCIVGEWSCALDPQSLRGLSAIQQDAVVRAYGAAQLLSYDTTRGWFFWTYKTADGGGWSFRDCVKRGWMPERYST